MTLLSSSDMTALQTAIRYLGSACEALGRNGMDLDAEIPLRLSADAKRIGTLVRTNGTAYELELGAPEAEPEPDPARAIIDALNIEIPPEVADALSTMSASEIATVIDNGLVAMHHLERSPHDRENTWHAMARAVDVLRVEADR